MRLILFKRSCLHHGFCVVIASIVIGISACTPASPPTPTPSPSPEVTAIPVRVVPTDDFCPPPRGWFVYETKPGDTLRTIADRTASTVELLAAGNCLQNPTSLNSGIIIYVPARPVGN